MFIAFVVTITLIVMNILLAITVNKTENLVYESKILQAKKRMSDVIMAIDHFPYLKKFWKATKEKMPKCIKSIFPFKRSILKRCRTKRNYKVSL